MKAPKALKCLRCGHEWFRRLYDWTPYPSQCPKCKSYLWRVARK